MQRSRNCAGRIFALAMASAVLLSGCGSAEGTLNAPDTDPTQRPAPISIVEATPSATPTAASTEFQFATADGPAKNVPVPVLPTTGRDFSSQGLLTFAEHWYSTETYLFATGDSAPLLAASSPDCGLCVKRAESVSKGYKGGNWIVGGQQAIYSTGTEFEPEPDGSYWVSLWIQETKKTYYNSDGSVYKDNPQESRYMVWMVAKYAEGLWQTQAIYLRGEEPKPLVYTEK